MVEDSKNPFDDFNAVSRSMGVPPEYLDFDILEIYTSYKNNPQSDMALATDMSIFDDVPPRREFIEKNAVYAKIDA